MAWGLLNSVEMPLTTGVWDESGNYVESTNNVPPGTLVNLIVYDGQAAYTPPPGYVLAQVDDAAKMGDFIGL